MDASRQRGCHPANVSRRRPPDHHFPANVVQLTSVLLRGGIVGSLVGSCQLCSLRSLRSRCRGMADAKIARDGHLTLFMA